MTALPRVTDVDGEITLLVWSEGVDHAYKITVGQAANLAQDLVDAMARRCRKLDGKEPVR